MNKGIRGGKSSELIVAGQLLRLGLDVYLPCVDDQAIDLLVRAEFGGEVTHYDVQVKSVKGYNRIIGIRNLEIKVTVTSLSFITDTKARKTNFSI